MVLIDGISLDSDSLFDGRCPKFIERKKPGKRIKINIAGQVFRTYEDTLDRMPETLLGNPERRQEYYDDEGKEYFFDRHRESFPAILYFYQSDGIMGMFKILNIFFSKIITLERPKWIPLDIFIEEIIFFDLIHYFVTVEDDAKKDGDGTSIEGEDPSQISMREKIWVRQNLNLCKFSKFTKPNISFPLSFNQYILANFRKSFVEYRWANYGFLIGVFYIDFYYFILP